VKKLIIADDLTGSMESALVAFRLGQFAELRFPWASGDSIAFNGHETVVLDTETRNLPERLAEEGLAKLLGQSGVALAYKKIDSTLRGNVVAEIRGIDAASGPRLQETGHQKKKILFFCPALPEQGRSIVSSQVFVRGIALENTEYAHDPLKPAMSGDTIALMRKAGYEAGSIGLGIVRQGPDSIESEIRVLIRDGFDCVIPDAETRGDLLSIALAMRSLEHVPEGAQKAIHEPCDFLPIGSAGLLEALFKTDRIVQVRDSSDELASTKGSRRIPHLVIVSGSRSATTLSQLELLCNTCAPERYQVFAPAEVDVDSEKEGPKGADGQRSAASGVAAFEEKVRDCAFRAERELRHFPDSVLFLTGGHTARIVLETLGVGGAEILGEPALLVPLCRAVGGRFDGLRFMTKAGGFGAPTLFGDILENAGRKE